MALNGAFDLVVADPTTIRAGLDQVYPRNLRPSHLDELEDETEEIEQQQSTIDFEADAESAPAVEEVNRLLRAAIELGASDIHFVPWKNDLHVRARVDGVMRDMSVVPRSLRASVIARIKVMGQLDIAERRLPQDGRVSISIAGVDMDLRVAILPSSIGEEAVLRIAYIGKQGLKTLEDLGLDGQTLSRLRHSLRHPAGAIIVAGPTGSGKTTTLYAALAELHDGTRTIVSIEDPVESRIEGVVQVEVNTRAGLTFARGLRSILRADPDVIMIGEIRDLETAEIALHAAMTGHIVLTTVHAQSSAAALVRLRDLGIGEASLGTSVRSVLSQRLLRRPCEHCAKGRRVSAEDLARIQLDTVAGALPPDRLPPLWIHRLRREGRYPRDPHDRRRGTRGHGRPRLGDSGCRPQGREDHPATRTGLTALRGRRDDRRRDRARARRARLTTIVQVPVVDVRGGEVSDGPAGQVVRRLDEEPCTESQPGSAGDSSRRSG